MPLKYRILKPVEEVEVKLYPIQRWVSCTFRPLYPWERQGLGVVEKRKIPAVLGIEPRSSSP